MLVGLSNAAAPAWAAPAGTAQTAATGAGTSAASPNLSALPSSRPAANLQSVTAVEVSGLVERRVTDSDVWTAVQKGDRFNALDVIRTGPDGSARIEFDGKIRIQILPDSELTIEEAQRDGDRTRQTLLKLNIGKLKADVDKLGPGSSFKVKTPTAVSAVRGTTFYLSVVRFAQGLQGIMTNLYVDKGKVDFASIENEINSLLVEAFHTSSAAGDGTTTESKELTPEEREALIAEFEKIFANGGNPQGGIETGALPPGFLSTFFQTLGEGDEDAVNRLIDALLDTFGEDLDVRDDEDGDGDSLDDLELALIQSQADLLSNGLDYSGGFDFEQVSVRSGYDNGIVSGDRTEILGRIETATDVAAARSDLQQLRDLRSAERDQLRQSLASILDNQDFLSEIAAEDKRVDAQTGKVFVDVHGNRVRTDQYVYHEAGSDLVRVLSLTLRAGGEGSYQNGITSVEFGVRFSENLDGETVLRNLPWNDYLNVVTKEEFDDRSRYRLSDLYLDQYIVHESSGGSMPSVHPVNFYAEFKNPAGDRIRFSENYSTLQQRSFYTDNSHEETTDLWYQGRIQELTEIQGAGWGGEIISYGKQVVSGGNYSYIQNIGMANVSTGVDDMPQSADFAGDTEGISDLDEWFGADHFLNHPLNTDGNSNNDVHPAFFEDRFTNGSRLIGMFIPIDNLGRVIDAPGFSVAGLRDLMNPNSEVVGGQYNLEAIFSYHQSEPVDESGSTEVFRIDAIITPEIFTPYGINASSSIFPDRLIDDDHDSQNNLD